MKLSSRQAEERAFKDDILYMTFVSNDIYSESVTLDHKRCITYMITTYISYMITTYIRQTQNEAFYLGTCIYTTGDQP